MCFSFGGSRFPCCVNHILFCDRYDPCDLNRLPQDSDEEDDWDEINLDNETKGMKRKRRWKWKCRRCCVGCCTCYCRVNPCNCLGGTVGRTINERHQLNPEEGLFIIITIKIIIFVVCCLIFFLTAFDKWYSYSITESSPLGPPKRGVEWWYNDLLNSNKEDSEYIANLNKRRYFVCGFFSSALFLFAALIYFIIFLCVYCRWINCGICWMILGFILIIPLFIYQIVQYKYLDKYYKYNSKTTGTTSTGDLTVIDLTERENGDVYPIALIPIWCLVILLMPYELWLMIWYYRPILLERLKYRCGIFTFDPRDGLLDEEEAYIPLPIFTNYQSNLLPAQENSSYRLAMDYVHGKYEIIK